MKEKEILVTLLLMANKEEKQWEYYGRLITIRPGQLAIPYHSLVQLFGNGMCVPKRRLLKSFAMFGFLTVESINDLQVITITNWENYIGIDEDWTIRHLTTPFRHPLPKLISPSTTKRSTTHA